MGGGVSRDHTGISYLPSPWDAINQSFPPFRKGFRFSPVEARGSILGKLYFNWPVISSSPGYTEHMSHMSNRKGGSNMIPDLPVNSSFLWRDGKRRRITCIREKQFFTCWNMGKLQRGITLHWMVNMPMYLYHMAFFQFYGAVLNCCVCICNQSAEPIVKAGYKANVSFSKSPLTQQAAQKSFLMQRTSFLSAWLSFPIEMCWKGSELWKMFIM